MKKSLIISLLLHFLILVLFLNLNHGNGDGTGNIGNGDKQSGVSADPIKHGEIIDKPIDVKLVELPPEPKEKEKSSLVAKQKKKSKVKNEDCHNFFGGIGIVWTPQSGQILEVHRGYPAEQAGFKPGDVLTGASEEINGEVGTPITIYLERNGVPYIADLIRAKICVDSKH